MVTHLCPCCGSPTLPLIDAVRAVLEMEPEATLGRVLWLTGSGDVSMVATMMRMVRLRAARATLQTSPQPSPVRCSTANSTLQAAASLPASPHWGAG